MADQKPERKQKTKQGYEIPVPKREEFDRFVKKVADPGSRKPPDEKSRPPQRSE
jgi:hypothetical protein